MGWHLSPRTGRRDSPAQRYRLSSGARERLPSPDGARSQRECVPPSSVADVPTAARGPGSARDLEPGQTRTPEGGETQAGDASSGAPLALRDMPISRCDALRRWCGGVVVRRLTGLLSPSARSFLGVGVKRKRAGEAKAVSRAEFRDDRLLQLSIYVTREVLVALEGLAARENRSRSQIALFLLEAGLGVAEPPL
jgi:hypothetical protein